MTDILLLLGESSSGSADLITKMGVDVVPFVAQTINFLIVAILLYKFAFKPVLKTVDERQKQISDGLQYAEEMKEKLAETEKKQQEALREASQEAQEIVSESRIRAKELFEKETQAASSKVEDMLRKGKEANELEREKMLSEVRQEISRLVVLTSAQVLQKELSDEDKKRYTESAAKELSALN